MSSMVLLFRQAGTTYTELTAKFYFKGWQSLQIQ